MLSIPCPDPFRLRGYRRLRSWSSLRVVSHTVRPTARRRAAAHHGVWLSDSRFMRRPAPAAWLGGLQPAAYGRLVVKVLGTESPFQVLLFSSYDDVVDERHRPDQRRKQPHAVDPDRDTELQE